MTRFAAACRAGFDAPSLADRLGEPLEAALGSSAAVAGAWVAATAAGGRLGEEVGQCLAERWPAAELVGTTFEGLVAEARVWQDEPAVAVLAWTVGASAPVPIAIAGHASDPEVLAKEILEAAPHGPVEPGDLCLLFPDALGSPALAEWLERLSPASGGPWLAGAAAVGLEGESAVSWTRRGTFYEEPALVGLWLPGQAARRASNSRGGPARRPRVQCVGATRAASPWLEITACRSHWIDALDGEPPIDWIRRQLGLAEDERVEPHLARLLIRVARAADPAAPEAAGEPEQFSERFVTGVDARRGSIGVVAPFARFDRLALALPDASAAREGLSAAVDALADGPLLLQFACPDRGERLHGDRDLESALVADRARGRVTFGVVAPFQLGTDPAGHGRLLVHSTVLASAGAPTSGDQAPAPKRRTD